MFLPGDNDVGGELSPVSESNVRRFEAAFSKQDYFRVDFLEIFVRDRFISASDVPLEPLNEGTFRLIVSHLPFVTVSLELGFFFLFSQAGMVVRCEKMRKCGKKNLLQ